MTQAQRKKALAEAEARLAEAQAAFDTAQKDYFYNEPLTQEQEKWLLSLAESKYGIQEILDKSPREYWAYSRRGRKSVDKSVFVGLHQRGMLEVIKGIGTSYQTYLLTPWGEEVAERLAKASKPEEG